MNKRAEKKAKTETKLPKVSFWRVVQAGLKINLAAIPFLYIIINIISVAHGVFQGIGVLMSQKLFDSAASVIAGQGASRTVYVAVLALGASFIIRELLNGLHNFMHSIVFDKCGGEAARRIHDKMARVDPVCLEDTALQDQINKAEQGAGGTIYLVNLGITVFTFYLPYFVFMAWYLDNVNPRFILAILLVFIPTLVGQLLKTGIIRKFEDEAAPVRRRRDFYDRSVTGTEFFKETRLLGAYRLLIGRFLDTCRELAKAERKSKRKENLLELLITALSTAGWAGIVYLLVTSLLAGEITVGAFAAVFSSIGALFGIMNEALSHMGRMAQQFGAAANYVRFMDLPERGGAARSGDPSRGITLRNVSFSYPNATEPSIKNVTLDILPGETVAVVGENGAGKSTLVRLLTGFYKPTEGIVTVRGINTSEADAKSLFTGVTGVFQKYQRYKMTLSENVGIGEPGSGASVTDALSGVNVELDAATFPDGEDTMLSREFDGVDLSGGQWQRVALARGLYRAHGLVVLDEPTAAIDPLEESRVYRQFMDISRGKTAIIVTHRLGSVKTADRVLVMDGGRLVAAAPHEELMRTCELYSGMYDSQAHWYNQ